MILCLIVGLTATDRLCADWGSLWPLLGLWDGVTRFIPILGPWLGAVLAVIIALTQGWDTASLMVVFILLLQLAENAILLPRIMRGAVGLSPLTVTVSHSGRHGICRRGRGAAGYPDRGCYSSPGVPLHRGTAGGKGLPDVRRYRDGTWTRGSVPAPAFAPLAPDGTDVKAGQVGVMRGHQRRAWLEHGRALASRRPA